MQIFPNSIIRYFHKKHPSFFYIAPDISDISDNSMINDHLHPYAHHDNHLHHALHDHLHLHDDDDGDHHDHDHDDEVKAGVEGNNGYRRLLHNAQTGTSGQQFHHHHHRCLRHHHCCLFYHHHHCHFNWYHQFDDDNDDAE